MDSQKVYGTIQNPLIQSLKIQNQSIQFEMPIQEINIHLNIYLRKDESLIMDL